MSLEVIRSSAELLARSGGELRLSFSGVSMRPTLESGTEVVVDCGAEASPDSVCVVVLPDRLLVHRVITKGDGWLLTRGDSNPLPDPPLVLEHCTFLGVVSGIVAGEDLLPLPPFRPTGVQRFLTSACETAVRVQRQLGYGFIRILWLARRFLWLTPKLLLRRLWQNRSAGRPDSLPPTEAESAEEAPTGKGFPS